jgi:putative FmdB family regulatory protein
MRLKSQNKLLDRVNKIITSIFFTQVDLLTGNKTLIGGIELSNASPVFLYLDLPRICAILQYSIHFIIGDDDMPLYEYQCINCGKQFEKMVRFSEGVQNQACPACQSQDTRKKISMIASLGKNLNGTGLSTGSSCTPRGGFS